MAFQKMCEACGATFTAHGNRAKFCPVCAQERALQSRREYDLRRREKRQASPKEPDEELFFADSPENIAACLNCKRKVCLLDMDKRCPALKTKDQEEG